MICIYDPMDKEFNGYGLGILHPQSCKVSEVAGGLYELEITMPITTDDRWMLLCDSAVIRAPVPCVATPRLQLLEYAGVEGMAVHRVVFGSNTLASARYLTIWAQSTRKSAALCTVPEFTELITTGETDHDGEWAQFITPDGICGWAMLYYTEYVREYKVEEASGEVIAPRQIRDQLFRIYAISQGIDGKTITARARHISYDQLYNPMESVILEAPTPATTASEMLMGALERQDHGFRVLTNLTGRVTGAWNCVNGVSMLLDPEHGLASMLRARVVRDNYDIFLLENTPEEVGYKIRYGRNLIGVGVDISDDAVYTRFVPLGKDSSGKLIRLPEGYVDSPHVEEYPIPRIKMWQVPGAQVGGKVVQEDGSTGTLDEAGVYALMRQAAAAEINAGEDELQCNVQVMFIDLGRTVEFSHFKALQTVSLYDWVTVLHGPHAIEIHMQVASYEFDCLTQRYTSLALGDVFADRSAGVI